jgi:hypothetical protein
MLPSFRLKRLCVSAVKAVLVAPPFSPQRRGDAEIVLCGRAGFRDFLTIPRGGGSYQRSYALTVFGGLSLGTAKASPCLAVSVEAKAWKIVALRPMRVKLGQPEALVLIPSWLAKVPYALK